MTGLVVGFLAGFPMVDFRVVLYDGSYHDVDSSELSFKLAARKAFRNAMQEAKPALLEPHMNVEIHAPVEYAGDLMGDLNGRRGRISGMDTKGHTQIIHAKVLVQGRSPQVCVHHANRFLHLCCQCFPRAGANPAPSVPVLDGGKHHCLRRLGAWRQKHPLDEFDGFFPT